ncbi:MAG: hypothetical protein GAK29_02513 [Acinetobacter bereziniae]|uniref:Uncharacterized protein n=1 Tax=Acinetobacter bereziniae TaxID=106648 RepID=A0A833PF24_ACIBZ|nr:MAG: hypothetical protein GAK29_02513 [Acinetobacter bereziniae]
MFPIDVSDRKLKKILLNSRGFILVQFYAYWWILCIEFSSIYDKISDEYGNLITYFKNRC